MTDFLTNVECLREMFLFLDFSSIKMCRVMSRAMHEASLPRFRDLSQVRINIGSCNPPRSAVDTDMLASEPVNLSDILLLINDPDDPLKLQLSSIRHVAFYCCEDPVNVPFDQLKFHPTIKSVAIENHVESRQLNAFLRSLDRFSNLKELILYIDNDKIAKHIKSRTGNRRNGYYFEQMTPNENVIEGLEKLVLCLPATGPQETFGERFRQAPSWRNFFKRFPNINHIRFEGVEVSPKAKADQCEFMEDFLDAISMIHYSSPSPLNISHIDFNYELVKTNDRNHLKGICDKMLWLGLPLQYLRFYIDCSDSISDFTDSPMSVISPVVRQSAKTLKTLRIMAIDDFPKLPKDDMFSDTVFPELIELEITSSNLRFVQLAPNLRKLMLVLSVMSCESPLTKPVDSWKCPFLTELVIHSSMPTMSHQDWRKLAEWMPAVTTLTGPLHASTLRVWASAWPKLRNLSFCELSYSKNDFHIPKNKGIGFEQSKLVQSLLGHQYLRSITFMCPVHWLPLAQLVFTMDQLKHFEEVAFMCHERSIVRPVFGEKVQSYDIRWIHCCPLFPNEKNDYCLNESCPRLH